MNNPVKPPSVKPPKKPKLDIPKKPELPVPKVRAFDEFRNEGMKKDGSFKKKVIGTALGAAVGGVGNAAKAKFDNRDASPEELKNKAAKGALAGGLAGLGATHIAGKTDEFLRKKYGPKPKDSAAYKAGRAVGNATKAVKDKFRSSSSKMNSAVKAEQGR